MVFAVLTELFFPRLFNNGIKFSQDEVSDFLNSRLQTAHTISYSIVQYTRGKYQLFKYDSQVPTFIEHFSKLKSLHLDIPSRKELVHVGLGPIVQHIVRCQLIVD